MVLFVFKILQNKIWEFLLNFALLATLGTERVNSCGIKNYKGALLSRVLRDLGLNWQVYTFTKITCNCLEDAARLLPFEIEV